MARVPNLSKTRFQAGLQCHKRLWLECYQRKLADPITPERLALFNAGHRFGELAREYYGGGVLVAEDFRHSEAAQQTTARLLADGAACLYEAALYYDGVLVRVDIVRRLDQRDWQLIEVKSSTQLKPEHITDAAIQTYVARGAGLSVSDIRLLHLKPGSRVPDDSGKADDPGGATLRTDEDDANNVGAAYDPDDLFEVEDITAQVEEYLPQIPSLLADMKTMLVAECPAIEVGEHCSQPYDCFFWGYCHGTRAETQAQAPD